MSILPNNEQLRKEGAPIVMVLPGAVYGPGDTSLLAQQMLVVMKKKLLGIPKVPAIYCYTHVDDVASGTWLAEEKGKVGEDYIFAGPPLALEEFYRTIANAAGVSVPRLRLSPRMSAWIYENMPGGKIVSGGLPLIREAVAMVTEANWAFTSVKAEKELEGRACSFEEGLVETLERIRENQNVL